jgi:hypothetical protein
VFSGNQSHFFLFFLSFFFLSFFFSAFFAILVPPFTVRQSAVDVESIMHRPDRQLSIDEPRTMSSVGKTNHQAAVAQALAALQADPEPEEALRLVQALREAAEALEWDLVRQARARKVSWARIGAVYGLTKQGAQQRFRREAEAPTQLPPAQ